MVFIILEHEIPDLKSNLNISKPVITVYLLVLIILFAFTFGDGERDTDFFLGCSLVSLSLF
jgi:hypothetical protein